jgi:hypothetical protein
MILLLLDTPLNSIPPGGRKEGRADDGGRKERRVDDGGRKEGRVDDGKREDDELVGRKKKASTA